MLGAHLGCPPFNADGQGRALAEFPEVWMPEIEMSTLKASPELRDQQNCILQAHWMRDEGLSPVSGRDTDRTVTTGPLVFSLVQAGLHRGEWCQDSWGFF